MQRHESGARLLAMAIVAVLCCVALTGCEYDVPITSGPTREVDERLVGDWLAERGKERMKVRRLDEFVYIVSYDCELFRAFHSDVAGTSFVSIQAIDPAERKYSYITYTVSADGNRLALRDVSIKVIPKETRDSASVQRLLEANLRNPDLLNTEDWFVRVK